MAASWRDIGLAPLQV